MNRKALLKTIGKGSLEIAIFIVPMLLLFNIDKIPDVVWDILIDFGAIIFVLILVICFIFHLIGLYNDYAKEEQNDD